jgi:truncated hemoglobin YjbI
MRHAPFAIDRQARLHWLALMNHALDTAALPDEPKELLRAFFESTATFLMNRGDKA